MTAPDREQRPPFAILTAAFLFNLGQGVLRPSMPLYLERAFHANYRMVTLIPVAFGAGKWVANIPTGYLNDRIGRPLMICGLLAIALVDVASVAVERYGAFLVLRGVGGVGWAMFATVATTAMVSTSRAHGRGRAVSHLMMSEASGLLLGSAAGGWVYQDLGMTSPFLFEAACMTLAAAAVARWASRSGDRAVRSRPSRPEPHALKTVLRTRGVLLIGAINALLIAIQTGIVVFLFPLYLVRRGGFAPDAVGLLVSLGVLGRLVALWAGGGLSDRYGRMRVLIPGLFVYAALLGSLAVLTQPILLAAWSFALGAVGGVVAAVPTALLSDQVPRGAQGIAIGWLRTVTDGGQIVGPLVMGIVADLIDLSAPFVLGAALLAAAAWQCRHRAREMAPGGAP